MEGICGVPSPVWTIFPVALLASMPSMHRRKGEIMLVPFHHSSSRREEHIF